MLLLRFVATEGELLAAFPTASSINNMLFKDVNNQRLQVYKGGAYTSYSATKSKVVTGEVAAIVGLDESDLL